MYAIISLQGLPHCEYHVAFDRVRHRIARSPAHEPLWHTGTIRAGLPAWVPIMVRELGLSEADRAMLLAAWYPCVIIAAASRFV